MAHRRGGFRGRGISESQRRKKAWIGVKKGLSTGSGLAAFGTSIISETPATAAAAGAHEETSFILVEDPGLADGDESSTLPDECTILRARGSLLFPNNSGVEGVGAGANLNTDQYGFGFGVTDIRSLSSGVQPGPILDVDWDGWMFLRQSALKPADANATFVDVKAMRKIKTGDAFFFSMQSVSADGVSTPAGVFVYDLRLLILLP